MTAEELKAGILDTFLRIADRFGVPCVILAVLLYFGREAAMALHGTVIEPVVKGHVEFLGSTSRTLEEMEKIQSKQAETLDELASGQRRLHEAITKSVNQNPEAPRQN